MKNNKEDLMEEDEYIESSRPRWWNPFWILLAISMIVQALLVIF